MAGVTALASFYMLYRENQKAAERERELQQKRNEIMTGFNDLADDIGRDILNGVKNFLAQNVDPIIANFDKQIKSVESFSANEQIKNEKLSELLTRTESLIAQIQA